MLRLEYHELRPKPKPCQAARSGWVGFQFGPTFILKLLLFLANCVPEWRTYFMDAAAGSKTFKEASPNCFSKARWLGLCKGTGYPLVGAELIVGTIKA